MADQRDTSSVRLDAFVDAAFAFAVTLLVIGGGAPPRNFPDLETAMARVPAFAVGFALLGMFWHAHVRWRKLCGNADVRGVLMSIALVFLVLVYVYPLRMMADSMVAYFTGGPGPLSYAADLAGLFTLYGLGFAGMAGLVSGLFWSGLRGELAPGTRPVIRGQLGIWLILTASGVLSVLLAQFRPTLPFAPWTYALLPVAIGIFTWRHRWEEAPPA